VLARGREERAATGLIAIPLVMWIAYIIAIGGDYFPAYRLIAPVMGLLALLSAQASDRLRRAWGIGRALATALALLVGYGLQQLDHLEITRARRETWVWNARAVSEVLETAFGRRHPLIAVTAAGSFPYWTNFPSVDMLGLNDLYLATHAPADFGQGWAGHELGDASYVLGRAPDLIQFSAIRHSEETGFFRVEKELVRSPEFQARYRLVTFQASAPSDAYWRIWVRHDSPRIGLVSRPEEVRVPGYLLTLNPSTGANLDSQGRLGAVILADRPAGIAGLELARGRWSIAIDADSPELDAATRPVGTTDYIRVGVAREIRSEGNHRLDFIVLGEGSRPVHVREVVFTRVAGE
jgi:hypothetical protein